MIPKARDRRIGAAILGAALDGARFTLCCGALFFWSVGEILFHHGLLRRHMAMRCDVECAEQEK